MSIQSDWYGNQFGLGFEPARIVFDLENECQDIHDALALQTPIVTAALAFLRKKIPLPRSAVPNVEGNFYRLPSHNRSFCYSLTEGTSIRDAPALVFKGSEPLLPDFPLMLDWMAQAALRKSSRVMSDHFPLAEGKIPGALSLKEALREAEIALKLHKMHMTHYGTLAKVPVPMLIHILSEGAKAACAETLKRKLSYSAFDRIQPLILSGLAIYIYYYPSPPIRANYLGDMGAPQFKIFFAESVNADAVACEWARLIVRMLYLGFLPYSTHNEGLGACMDFGNAALDGGFCDPDSIIEIESDADDEFFRESAIQSLLILQSTIQRVVGLASASPIYPSIEEFVYRLYVMHLIHEAVISEERPGLRLDRRFMNLISPKKLGDVKVCANRRNRIQTYSTYTKRIMQRQAERRDAGDYP